ncbi:MAG: addiction module toxin, HicA family [Gemmatimonadota bacterium]|nr:addiction module toxin, HicA family [Candidatus Palauibacter scopulicola]
MKRRDLLRHLTRHGCAFLREGGNHTLYINRDLARKICKDLQVPRPPDS